MNRRDFVRLIPATLVAGWATLRGGGASASGVAIPADDQLADVWEAFAAPGDPDDFRNQIDRAIGDYELELEQELLADELYVPVGDLTINLGEPEAERVMAHLVDGPTGWLQPMRPIGPGLFFTENTQPGMLVGISYRLEGESWWVDPVTGEAERAVDATRALAA